MKILHCITGLSPDGAQQMLLRLVAQLKNEGHELLVVSLSAPEPFAAEFKKHDVQVEFLHMQRGIPSVRSLRQFSSIIRSFKPDLIQGWMYHANVYSVLARIIAGERKIPVLWNIRRSLYEYKELRLTTRITILISRLLSRFVTGCVYCTDKSKEQHKNFGFRSKKEVIIENGFDLDTVRPRSEYRESLRDKLGVAAESRIVGIVGRYDVSKNFPNFFTAAQQVLEQHPNTSFVCVGRNLDEKNQEIKELIKNLGIQDSIHLLGQQKVAYKLIAGFDVYCSSSRSEGFPNTIAEALACAVPCVVTDVGASAKIVAKYGAVVPSENSSALADGISTLLSLSDTERQALGTAGRQSIEARYSIAACTKKYLQFYSTCLARNTFKENEREVLDATG